MGSSMVTSMDERQRQMFLRLDKSGAVYPVDAAGRTPMIEVELAYSSEYVDEFATKIPEGYVDEEARTFTLTIPRYWVERAMELAFRFDGWPVSMTDVLDDKSELGIVARADATAGEDWASTEVHSRSLARQCELSTAATVVFEKSLRDRLPAFVKGLIECSVQEVRDDEEKRAKVPLPWSERSIPMGKKRGGRRGDSLGYYLKVRARQLRTNERLLTIFGSEAEERAKTRYYEGRKVYLYLRSRYEFPRSLR
jgi:hypothetical protein